MPYKDPEKRREFLKRWRDKNRERVNAKRRKGWREGKRVGDLRVVLTPLTRAECQVYIGRLQRRKVATRDVECRACTDRAREKAERVQEAKRRKLEQNREWKKANRERVREYKRKWRENNPEKMKARRERERARRKARLEGDEERLRKAKEKAREQKQRWRQANPEKVREQQRKRRQAHPEKVREQERKRQQVHSEKAREQKQRWRENNPEKLKAQRERERARRKARLEADEERARATREKVRERKRRYREANREKLRERKRRWRKNNPEKAREQRERENRARKGGDEESRRKRREWSRRYHEAHKEERNRARRERYARQKGRPVPPVAPPCDCGVCLACGGWDASWKPVWHARLNAFCTKKDPPPVATLEELPLDLLESETETETLSVASTSEIDSELGDRLDALLADESDSEVETVDKVEAPTRRSSRIATMPVVSYQDWEEENPMWEFLKRKAQLHAEAEDRIVTRWEMLQHRTERVDAIVEEMSTDVDPRRELDRFHSQLERQDGVLDVMVSEELLDFVDDQLWEPFGETMNV